jgi:tetratricopeptide (TPR) repeat protein
MSVPLPARATNNRPALNPTERILRRRLIFQDSLSIVTLIVISICIGVLTYFFFGSFQEHRSVLEKRWYARGQKALASGHPTEAVPAFRSALSLSAANPDYEMSLAEALAASGHTEEAYAYFSSLHDAKPGDGFLNLQLARLAVRQNNPARAIAFYQAALNGLWYGQGTARRFQIRLELSKYLMTLGKANEAQGQLLAAEGNSLDRPAAILEVANLLAQASDPSDAWTAYRRIEVHPGASTSQALQALEGEATVAQSMGQYKRAAQSLDRYVSKVRQHPSAATSEEKQAVRRQLACLQQMLQLIPFYALPPKQRYERLLRSAAIAHQRYVSCSVQLQTRKATSETGLNATGSALSVQNQSSPDATRQDDANLSNSNKSHSKLDLFAKSLSRFALSRKASPQPAVVAPAIGSNDSANFSALGAQWPELQHLKPANLAGNAPLEQTLGTWTSETELLTAKLCGPPSGNDALLLQLAQTPDKTE